MPSGLAASALTPTPRIRAAVSAAAPASMSPATTEAPADASRKPESELSAVEFRQFVRRQVYQNPYIWIISLANFNVYVVRYAFLNWGPTYLQEVRGWSKLASGGLTGAFELAGLCGSLLAGYITDRWMRGRRAPLCVLYMVGAAVATWLCAYTGHTTLSFWLAGFTVYGPQFLVGVMMADLATRRATSTFARKIRDGSTSDLNTRASASAARRTTPSARW